MRSVKIELRYSLYTERVHLYVFIDKFRAPRFEKVCRLLYRLVLKEEV